jgi:thiosulfate/3-mercaptopyruvate sulfurtransferase
MTNAASNDPGPLVSTDWLAAELGAPDLRVFDATVFLNRSEDGTVSVDSGADAWAEAHIPTSGHLDLIGELSDPTSSLGFTAPPLDALAAAFAARGVGDGTRVVLYDAVLNMWATRVWWLLRSIGFDAAVLDGGLVAWQHDGHATSTDPEPEHPIATLTVDPHPELFTDSTAVQSVVSSGSACILNALPPDNHNGNDTSYGRPGHIPGANNVSAMGLVDPVTRRYRPLAELRTEFEAAGALSGPTITYCGGGIAATSDAFILHLLGNDDVAVYDGSLRDWSTRGLPLEI